MRKLALFVLFAVSVPLLADRADLDGDGKEDCWTKSVDGGSGSSTTTLTIETPCGGRSFTIEVEGSFASFVSHARRPDGISDAFAKNIAKILFEGNELREAKDLDPTFLLLLGYAPRWSPGLPSVPPNQVFVEMHRISAYYAHNHGELRKATQCGGFEVYATNHALALYDEASDESKWIYLAQGVVEKLRWPSIEGVVCADDAIKVNLRNGQTIDFPIVFYRRAPSAPPSASSPGT